VGEMKDKSSANGMLAPNPCAAHVARPPRHLACDVGKPMHVSSGKAARQVFEMLIATSGFHQDASMSTFLLKVWLISGHGHDLNKLHANLHSVMMMAMLLYTSKQYALICYHPYVSVNKNMPCAPDPLCTALSSDRAATNVRA